MATYQYQQNVYEGASYGYVKYNITPDFGTPVAPGEMITITGQAYFKNSAKQSIEVRTSASGTFRRSGVNVSIPRATVTSFTLTFQMWELTTAWGTGRVRDAPIRFIMWDSANMDGGGDGTVEVDAQKICYLTYRINPSVRNVEFERYSQSGSTYFKDDEGNDVLGKLAISLGEGYTVSDITVATAVVNDDAGSTQRSFTISSSVLTAALSSPGYVENAPGLFSTVTFNTAYNYTITFTIGDAYDTAVFSVLVTRAFANMHLSGKTTGGVAFGKFSSAAEGNPLFECEYPAYFNAGIASHEYHDGDVVTIDKATFLGYVTSSTKSIQFVIPLRKSLERITSATITALVANIANAGGYGITSSHVAGGSNYIVSSVTVTVTVDSIRNVLEVTLERSTAWKLTNNTNLSVRNELCSFVLHE